MQVAGKLNRSPKLSASRRGLPTCAKADIGPVNARVVDRFANALLKSLAFRNAPPLTPWFVGPRTVPSCRDITLLAKVI